MTSVSLSVVPSGWSTVRLNFRPDGTARTGDTMRKTAMRAAKMLRRMVILRSPGVPGLSCQILPGDVRDRRRNDPEPSQGQRKNPARIPDDRECPVDDAVRSAEVVEAHALVGDRRGHRIVVHEAPEDPCEV